jgi:hypothetical protein
MARSTIPPSVRLLRAIMPDSAPCDDDDLAHRVEDALREMSDAPAEVPEHAVLLPRAARLRRGLADATDDFLHDVARASRDDALSDEAYAALTAELETKRRTIIASTLASLLPPPPPPRK